MKLNDEALPSTEKKVKRKGFASSLSLSVQTVLKGKEAPDRKKKATVLTPIGMTLNHHMQINFKLTGFQVIILKKVIEGIMFSQ